MQLVQSILYDQSIESDLDTFLPYNLVVIAKLFICRNEVSKIPSFRENDLVVILKGESD